MQLKKIVDSPCGIRYMLDQLDLQSGYARRWLLDRGMMTSADEILAEYDRLRRFLAYVESLEPTLLHTLLFKLQGLKDIRTTIKNLSQRATLDDIELFEVKHLAILSTDVFHLLRAADMHEVVCVPDLEEVISILDPDGMKIATFYVYDSYCAELRELRNKIRLHPEQEDLLFEANEIEASVRADLCKMLFPYAAVIEQAQAALAQLDVILAKARQIQSIGLTIPGVSINGTTCYKDLFHPQVKASLANDNRSFQPVDIQFDHTPTLITGANMGGKTVVLKTLTLCQYLFQFGFGIPASGAEIAVRDDVFFCIGDEQSIERGLSSFAAEMKNIDAVIKASRQNKKILALIDEPARTTNPTEGSALVEALIKVLDGRDMSLVLTTHYDINPGHAHCLRVKGFEDGRMNYTLVEVDGGEVPHEALNIAESLDIDRQWISEARRLLETAAAPHHIVKQQLI